MLNTSFSPWPSFTLEEATAIQHVLLSNKVNYWTGTEGRLFEQEFAKWCGTRYAVALANGTVALELALRAVNIKPGDEVIVTPRTFLASVSCIVSLGAIPVFADVDRDSQAITAQSISNVITSKTKAIIVVHLAGWPAEMDEIMELSNQHKLYVIEDCAQAHGATYKGKSVGSIGHIGAWSFCQDKIMTTAGEGGMVTTNDKTFWSKMWSYKDHGKSWNAVYKQRHPTGFRWLHDHFGTNWRMTEIQSAIGRIQLKRMSKWQKKRLQNATKIWRTAQKFDVFRVPEIPDYIEHAAYKCYFFINMSLVKTGWSKEKILQVFNSEGVPCFSGSCSEVYLEKAFDGTSFRPINRLKIAKELGETSIMFLVHPTLKASEIKLTCDVIKKVASIIRK